MRAVVARDAHRPPRREARRELGASRCDGSAVQWPDVVREMLISHDPNETRVAVLEDRELVELYIERAKRSVVGNVYLGKVTDVLPGMQAAFVDIGLEKNAFLYVDEVVAPEGLEDVPRRDIQSLLKPGQQVMVQVAQGPDGHQGRARHDRDHAARPVPRAHAVLGVRRRLARSCPDDERDRLHEIVARHRARRDWA